jgi:hypothetical protein
MTFATAALAGLFLAGCSFVTGPSLTGSGNLVTKQYPFTNFSGVSAGSVFDVTVKPGTTAGVSVTVDDNLVEYLDVKPELTSLDLSGASKGRVQGCRSAKALDIDLSGASHLEGDLESGDMHMGISGASRADLKGTAGNLRLNVSGASHADLEELQIKDANVDVDGASHATVHPSGKLQARASGASSVLYAGQPANVDSQTSGASSVKPK